MQLKRSMSSSWLSPADDDDDDDDSQNVCLSRDTANTLLYFVVLTKRDIASNYIDSLYSPHRVTYVKQLRVFILCQVYHNEY